MQLFFRCCRVCQDKAVHTAKFDNASAKCLKTGANESRHHQLQLLLNFEVWSQQANTKWGTNHPDCFPAPQNQVELFFTRIIMNLCGLISNRKDQMIDGLRIEGKKSTCLNEMFSWKICSLLICLGSFPLLRNFCCLWARRKWRSLLNPATDKLTDPCVLLRRGLAMNIQGELKVSGYRAVQLVQGWESQQMLGWGQSALDCWQTHFFSSWAQSPWISLWWTELGKFAILWRRGASSEEVSVLWVQPFFPAVEEASIINLGRPMIASKMGSLIDAYTGKQTILSWFTLWQPTRKISALCGNFCEALLCKFRSLVWHGHLVCFAITELRSWSAQVRIVHILNGFRVQWALLSVQSSHWYRISSAGTRLRAERIGMTVESWHSFSTDFLSE